MKKWNLTLLTLILILLSYLFFKDNIKKTLKPINTVVQPEALSIKVTKESISKKIKVKEIPPHNPSNLIAGYDKEIDQTPSVDYVTAYREFKKFKRCRRIIESLENGHDPYKDFIASRSKKIPFELSVIQQQQFDIYVDICNNMLAHDGELYTAAAERYRKRFYQAQPKTKEAKDLAASWPLKVETEHISFKYHKFINGYNPDNSRQVRVVKKQLRRYNGMLDYINRNNDIEYSGRTQNEIRMYELQITELTNIVDGITVTDDDYLVALYQNLEANVDKIHSFLKQNQSGEAFMTLAPKLYFGKQLEFGFPDNRYFKSIIQPTLILYACSLGLPCGKNSKNMLDSCMFSNKANDLACDKTVENYYLNYYFSPNQLLDIDHIIGYFIKNHAKK